MASSQGNVDLQTRVSYSAYTYGRRLSGTGRDGPLQNFMSGGTAHASVPPIFREAVLSDACESKN